MAFWELSVTQTSLSPYKFLQGLTGHEAFHGFVNKTLKGFVGLSGLHKALAVLCRSLRA